MRIVQIGDIVVTDQDAKSARDAYPITTRVPIVPLRHGGFDQDGGQVIFQPTTLSRNFLIAGENIPEQIDRLKGLLHQRTILIAELRDGRRRVTYVKLDGATYNESTVSYQMQVPVNISWTRTYPFWFDADHLDFLDTGLTLDSGQTTDRNYQQEVIVASPHTFALFPAYNGGLPGRYITFIFVPRAASSIANLTVENTVNGFLFRYHGTVAANQQLYVDNLTKTVMNNSTDDWANFELPDTKQIDLMRLETSPGNNFKVLGTVVGTVDLYVRWVGEFL